MGAASARDLGDGPGHVVQVPGVQRRQADAPGAHRVDAELVLHTMIHYKHYQQAIIVSGDGDFHCLVEYLHNRHKLLRILAPNKHYSKLLHEYNELVVRIDLLKTNLQLDEKTKKTKISVRSKP